MSGQVSVSLESLLQDLVWKEHALWTSGPAEYSCFSCLCGTLREKMVKKF